MDRALNPLLLTGNQRPAQALRDSTQLKAEPRTVHMTESSEPVEPIAEDTIGSDSQQPEARSHAEEKAVGIPISKVFEGPPALDAAKSALDDITTILKPPRKSGAGYKPFEGDAVLQQRLELMKMFLWTYIDKSYPCGWIAASKKVAHAHQKGSHTPKSLRAWTRNFIRDRDLLPFTRYGTWNESLLEKGDLANAIHLHLQEIGKYVKAEHIIHFLDQPEVIAMYSLSSNISLMTARRWMHMMDYRWSKSPSGQYVDGHERKDVVEYRQTKFLPAMAELDSKLRRWENGEEELRPEPRPGDSQPMRHTVIWWHDESTFYANDRRDVFWVHKDEKAVPRPKGEGTSLMVSDFFSADYGWLSLPDGTDAARWLFKAGKNRDGYFTNENILEQLQKAMDILREYYPNEDHVFVYDNATTHLKRADDALSARKMSKGPTRPGRPIFGVQRTVVDVEGKVVHRHDGKPLKEKVRMADGQHPDGSPQSFYFPEGHERAGVFKGMQQILEERGFKNLKDLPTECSGFKCPKGSDRCCCRRLLYRQPDFEEVESLLEMVCRAGGYSVIFLPKFHCELNPIEQCWCNAKQRYRTYSPTTSEAKLEENVVTALDSVPRPTMRRCVCLIWHISTQ